MSHTAKLRAAAERDGISMHAAVLKAVDDYLDAVPRGATRCWAAS